MEGRRETIAEYLHKLRTERFQVGCDGMQPLVCTSIDRYLMSTVMRIAVQLRWYRGNLNPRLLSQEKAGIFFAKYLLGGGISYICIPEQSNSSWKRPKNRCSSRCPKHLRSRHPRSPNPPDSRRHRSPKRKRTSSSDCCGASADWLSVSSPTTSPKPEAVTSSPREPSSGVPGRQSWDYTSG